MVNTKLIESLQRSKWQESPWDHFIIENILTDEQVAEIRGATVERGGVLHDGTRSGYVKGVEKQNHKLREYITKENCDKYPELTKFIEELQGRKARELIADMVGNEDDFAGSYVRLEILNDTEGFWLQPHCDIPEKLISSLVYVNKTGESINLGTDLYNEDLELVKTVPFWHNYGYIFHGPNKWHGMNKGKNIKVERRGVQINYVTFQTDWPVHED